MNPRYSLRPFNARSLALVTVLPAMCFFLSPVTVTAQQGARMPDFAEVDTNGDGFVSASELAAFRAQRMAQSAAEGQPPGRGAGPGPAGARRQVATFEAIDLDGDGCIDREELAERHRVRGKTDP